MCPQAAFVRCRGPSSVRLHLLRFRLESSRDLRGLNCACACSAVRGCSCLRMPASLSHSIQLSHPPRALPDCKAAQSALTRVSTVKSVRSYMLMKLKSYGHVGGCHFGRTTARVRKVLEACVRVFMSVRACGSCFLSA
eukprot:6206184-Pleurochrysis_carterae.AAC.1